MDLRVWGQRAEIKVPSGYPGASSLPGSRAAAPLCDLTRPLRGTERGLGGTSFPYRDTSPSDQGPVLRTSFNLNHPPKGPSPPTAAWGLIRASAGEFRGDVTQPRTGVGNRDSSDGNHPSLRPGNRSQNPGPRRASDRPGPCCTDKRGRNSPAGDPGTQGHPPEWLAGLRGARLLTPPAAPPCPPRPRWAPCRERP